jgi:amino acid adenylation domain-containing protein
MAGASAAASPDYSGFADLTMAGGFLRACERFPDRPALAVGGSEYSYEEIRGAASAVAEALMRLDPDPEPRLSLLLARRSLGAFAGMLGTLFSGRGYVPMNPRFPARRVGYALQQVGCRSIVVDAAGLRAMPALLEDWPSPLGVVAVGVDDLGGLPSRFPRHRFACLPGSALRAAPAGAAAFAPIPSRADDVAYIIFTSGSTGTPKGVTVTHSNAASYVANASRHYEVGSADRFSNLFEFTFDGSVHDVFVPWFNGACVCCASPPQCLMPSRYILDSRLTCWFSVPSVVVRMEQMGALAEGTYPTLRMSMLGGEGVPHSVCEAWLRACPNTALENVCGPTEGTVWCITYRWTGDPGRDKGDHGLVPIGDPWADVEALVVDEELAEVPDGRPGELIIGGPQVAAGYWKDPEKTGAAFIPMPGRQGRYYRTGDVVRRAAPGAPLMFIGRRDHQVQIKGHRVELGEVENSVRGATGAELAAAIGWPESSRGVEGLVAFVEAERVDEKGALQKIAAMLPRYMVPSAIRALPKLPLNENGKVDRNALRERLSGS